MKSPLAHYLYTQTCNNAWANQRLLAACAGLSPAEFVATRTSFFPSIKATLNHIVTVDWFYVDALERSVGGDPPNHHVRAFFEPREPFDRCEALAQAQRAVDRRLIDLCRGLTDAELERPVAIVRASGIEHEAATRLLAHLFQHQIHHRGQVHAMLSGTPIAPPQLDEFFCANEAHLRAAELAQIGLSEAQIWSDRSR